MLLLCLHRIVYPIFISLCFTRLFKSESFNKYVRTKGGGGQANAQECVQRWEGGWHIKYVRKAENYQLLVQILQYFHLQRTLHRYLINVVRIQLKLLLVQECQTYGQQAESVNVAP